MADKKSLWTERLSSAEYDQSEILPGADVPQETQDRFFKQVDALDKSLFPGGLLNYLQRARVLLRDSKNGVNPYAGFTVCKPEVVTPELGSAEFWSLEEAGLARMGKMGFVLVAGGLGERLGYQDIKISLPVSIVTDMCYMQYYAECILAYQKWSKVPLLPLAIMTSDDTHDKTVALLEKNNFFGLKKYDQVHLIRQGKVPALKDNAAHMAISSDFQLETKPHGHGDVHVLMAQNKLPEKWMKEFGTEYIVFLQDTNALMMRAVPLALGVSLKNDLAMNSVCVPRSPGEAAGAVCVLVHKENEKEVAPLTINVEYNFLGPLLKDAGLGGDKPEPGSTLSPYPGNVNVLLFRLADYSNALLSSGGSVPEFINPKYADAEREKFKSSTRVECLMQEFARMLPSGSKHGVTMLPRIYCFSAVKNSREDSIAKQDKGIPPENCLSGECDFYNSNTLMLKMACEKVGTGASFANKTPVEYSGCKYEVGPKVVINPSFAPCAGILSERIKAAKSIVLGKDSTFVVSGDVVIKGSLTLDDAAYLELCGNITLENISVNSTHLNGGDNISNQFFELGKDVELADVALSHKIRGYSYRKSGCGGSKICSC